MEKKDGNTLIESIVESIGRMLNRKMDAVKCIVNKSEEYAEEFHRNEMLRKNFTYYSSKFSMVNFFINGRGPNFIEHSIISVGEFSEPHEPEIYGKY